MADARLTEAKVLANLRVGDPLGEFDAPDGSRAVRLIRWDSNGLYQVSVGQNLSLGFESQGDYLTQRLDLAVATFNASAREGIRALRRPPRYWRVPLSSSEGALRTSIPVLARSANEAQRKALGFAADEYRLHHGPLPTGITFVVSDAHPDDDVRITNLVDNEL